MFADVKMFYKFEIDYVYHPEFHLIFDNVETASIYKERRHMSNEEIAKYMESSEEVFIGHELIGDVLFGSEGTARYFLHNRLMGEIVEHGYNGWYRIPIHVSVQDLPEDDDRFLVYDEENLVAVVRLNYVGYSFV